MTDLRSGPACSMLFRASRTSRAVALQWPLGSGRGSELDSSGKEAGKCGEALENREDEDDGLEKSEEDEGEEEEEEAAAAGMREETDSSPEGTGGARLLEKEEAEPEEVEDDGLAFCVDICGDSGRSKYSIRSWWLLVSMLCAGGSAGGGGGATEGTWEISEMSDSSSSNDAAAAACLLRRFSLASVASGEGEGELTVRSRISSSGLLEDRLGDGALLWSGRAELLSCEKLGRKCEG